MTNPFQQRVVAETGNKSVRATPERGSARWWSHPVAAEAKDGKDTPCTQVHTDLVPYVQSLQVAWRQHDTFDRIHDRIYENRKLLTYNKAIAALQTSGFDTSRLAATTNIVKTFVSRFSRRRPMPMFVVDGAEWSLKRRAQKFRKLLWAKMMETETDRRSVEGLTDAEVRGSGILYIDEGDNDVVVERVHRWELFVDPHEASAGEKAVRQMHRVMRVAREVLSAMFPDAAEAIRNAPPAQTRPHENSTYEWASPMAGWVSEGVVDVYASWHLPSSDDEGDGRKAICIDGATLCFEEWKRPRFPFAILRRHRRQDGFWGQGDVELLAEDQADINRTARDIQRNVETLGHAIVFTNDQMDATPTEKLTGRGPFRVRFKGQTPPVYHVPQAVQPATLGYLEKRIAWMHDFSGVSQWSAQGRSPLGAGASGTALDTMEDIQSDRHAEFEAAYSHWRCDIAQRILDACRAVAERMKEAEDQPAEKGEKRAKRKRYGAAWMQGERLERLDWDDVALDEEQYQLQIEPISYIPSTRAGKMAYAKELMGMGLLNENTMRALFDEPDVAQHNKIENAAYNRALDVMEILGDPDEEAPVPEELWDLELHLFFARAYYQIAQNERAPEEVQARYRDYADLVIAQQNKQKEGERLLAAADPAAAMAGAPPMDPALGGMPPGDPKAAMPPGAGPPMPQMPPLAA